MKTCTHCEAANAADARFCNQCGQALSGVISDRRTENYTPRHLLDRVLKHRSALEGERKQVTVMFADMSGSTQLSAAMDAEAWHGILDEYFAILSEEVHRFEGTINQFTGDGIMALFGAPLALEDHAQRAALAALSLQRRLREFADRLRLVHGINPSTRMGLNSGEVVVGRIGDDLRMDYTAKGLTVNLAARMEQIAQPGCVYLTRHCAALIEDYFELRALGPMRIKGQEQPLEVFELLGQTSISLRLEASRRRGLTGFAGRQDELERLLAAQRRSAGGQREVLAVVGDGGLGKSRLCHEARELWLAQGIAVLSCSGVPYAQAVPLQPVRQLLLQGFGVAATDAPSMARQKIAGRLLLQDGSLRDSLPALFEFLQIAEPGGQQAQIAPEVRDQRNRDLFRRLCALERDRPRVLLIEDLHWMDEGSMDFIDILLECSQAAAVLLVINTRPGALPDWLERHQPQLMPLQPLGETAMAQMTRSLLGGDDSVRTLALRIAQQAAGNPFYIEESVRALVSAGRLDGEPGRYRLRGDADRLDIPASVHAIIAGRVDQLHDQGKELLKLAAVLGQKFEMRLLQAVSGLDETTLQTELQALDLGSFLRAEAASTGVLAFCHPLIQDVVYGSLLRERRQGLHRHVAQLLERHFANTTCQRAAVLLAHHWGAAGAPVRAANWCVAAAGFLATQDPTEELRYLRRAIDLLAASDEDTAVPIAISARAGLLRLATFYPVPDEEVEERYAEAREMARRCGDGEATAELLISNGIRQLNRADADRAVESTGEAMRLAQDLGAQSLEARFRIPILFSYFSAGRLHEGLTVLDRRDGGLWHQGPMQQDNMLSRGFRALMLAARGELELAENELQASILCVETHQVQMSWLHANLVDVQLLRGTLQDGIGRAQKALSQAQLFGSPMFIEIARRAQAQALMAAGEAGPARDLLVQSLDLVAPGKLAVQFASAHRTLLAQALQELGEVVAAMAQIEQAVALGEHSRQRVWTLRARLRQGEILLAQHQPIDRVLAQCEDLIEVTAAEVFRAEVMALRARRARQCGDQAAAQNWCARAMSHWQTCGAPRRAEQLRQEISE